VVLNLGKINVICASPSRAMVSFFTFCLFVFFLYFGILNQVNDICIDMNYEYFAFAV